jgi:hypothetical protein
MADAGSKQPLTKLSWDGSDHRLDDTDAASTPRTP